MYSHLVFKKNGGGVPKEKVDRGIGKEFPKRRKQGELGRVTDDDDSDATVLAYALLD